MITVNGNPILASEKEVLEEVRRQSYLNGLDLFRIIRPSGHNLMTNCPFHKRGLERKPSFGVSTRDMSCHCFSCGWADSLDVMISSVFGYEDEGAFGRKWLVKNFLSISVENRPALELPTSRRRPIETTSLNLVSEAELDSYRYYHPYMYERGLTDEIIEKFDVGYDDATKCLTFPVKDYEGRVLFIARRSVNTKFFNYPENVQKPVYGAELFRSGEYKSAIICESIINTLTCWVYDRPSMSLIGTGTDFQYSILRALPVRKYIVATDPDEAGQKAYVRFKTQLGRNKIVTQYVLPDNQDINDIREELLRLPEYF